MKEIEELKTEIEKIKERNKRVEADKAWETSLTRTLFISATTFVLGYALMLLIKESEPFGKAFVGTVLYFLSTSTYGIIKNWWLKRRK